MGWKIELGLAAAAIFGLVVFRNQIGTALSDAGGAIGSGIGGAFNNALMGFGQAFYSNPYGEGGLLGQWWKDMNKGTSSAETEGMKKFLSNSHKVLGPSIGGSAKHDQTITSYNREYMDVRIIKPGGGDLSMIGH